MTRPALAFSAATVAAMGAASLWAWSVLPGDARIPVHFGLDGRPDRFAGPLLALSVLPAAAALLAALLALLPRFEPRAANLAGSGRAYRASWIAAIALLGLAHALLVAAAMGHDPDVPAVMALGVGALLAATGNLAGKIRPNRSFGLRTPWTLASDHVWNRSHRVLGRLSVAAGLALAGVALLRPAPETLAAATILALATVAGGGAAASWRIWRRDVAGKRG